MASVEEELMEKFPKKYNNYPKNAIQILQNCEKHDFIKKKKTSKNQSRQLEREWSLPWNEMNECPEEQEEKMVVKRIKQMNNNKTHTTLKHEIKEMEIMTKTKITWRINPRVVLCE